VYWRSIGGISSGRRWCSILLPATIWVRDVMTLMAAMTCHAMCAATALADDDSPCRQMPAQIIDVGLARSGGRGDLVLVQRLGATGRDDGPHHPCHGSERRPIPVIFAGQKTTRVRLCPAVQSRHRNASLLILKSSLLILKAGVRNNALSWWIYGDSNPRPLQCHGRSPRLARSRWVASVQFRAVALSD
jgi:hypothetical protein